MKEAGGRKRKENIGGEREEEAGVGGKNAKGKEEKAFHFLHV